VHAATPSCPDERDDVLAPREHKEFPKPMTDEVVCAADVVVTMGCGDACPIYPGKRSEDWGVDDPVEADRDGVRRIRGTG
jgi:arsenate reductase (thioredoxin)